MKEYKTIISLGGDMLAQERWNYYSADYKNNYANKNWREKLAIQESILDEKIKKMADQGWRLISVTQTGSGENYSLFFERDTYSTTKVKMEG